MDIQPQEKLVTPEKIQFRAKFIIGVNCIGYIMLLCFMGLAFAVPTDNMITMVIQHHKTFSKVMLGFSTFLAVAYYMLWHTRQILPGEKKQTWEFLTLAMTGISVAFFYAGFLM